MQPVDDAHLGGVALLDGNLGHAVAHLPVEGGRGQRHVEGHAVVVRGQRLEIGADLVGHVAGVGRAVGAGDDQVDQAVLHEMAAHVVGDDRVRHAVLAQFPGGEAGALVARPRLVHPDVDGDAPVVGGVDGRGGRAVVDKGQPAGVAVGQHVDRLAALAPADLLDERHAVLADAPAELGILVGDDLRRLLDRRLICASMSPPAAAMAANWRSTAHARLTAVGRVAFSCSPVAATAGAKGCR